MRKENRSGRSRFPEDEKRHSWLPLLLDAYDVIDRGIARAVSGMERSSGERLACRPGCDGCCRSQKDIPVYPLELTGMYWYAIEKVAGASRTSLEESLRVHEHGSRCPFLIGSACAVYPVRPIACRQFNVLGNVCADGEDPYYTRRDDVVMPYGDVMDRALSIMLPFYGVTGRKAVEEYVKNRLIHIHARVLQSLNWKELARRMGEANAAERGG